MRFAAWALLCAAPVCADSFEYRLLATTKTSTMEKEMNEAAASGYVYSGVMGGETGFGNKEVVVVMTKGSGPSKGNKKYMLLAASKTSTLEKELQQAGADGFEYRGQTVFESALAGREVSVILERNAESPGKRIEYKVLATNRTSSMEKELLQAGGSGFQFLGVVVGKTAFGGREVISILKKTAE